VLSGFLSGFWCFGFVGLRAQQGKTEKLAGFAFG